jgi:glycosyltransferase involved in cell wall biosynthesis
MKTSLIITTYNWTSALDAVLRTVLHQTTLPDEVIIADDGSALMTRELIVDWAQRLGCPLIHIWQADTNFRAARARNLAILKAFGDHLIFIDGDCLLPPHFIKNHRRMITPGSIISGGRLLLTKEQSETVLADPNPCGDKLKIFSGFKHIDLSWVPFRGLFPLSWRAVRTCNVAALKKDVLAVRGFDEAYTGWGKEDSDLAVRMKNFGFKMVSGRFGACVSHLFHKQQSRGALQTNEAALAEVIGRSSSKPGKSCLRSIHYEG